MNKSVLSSLIAVVAIAVCGVFIVTTFVSRAKGDGASKRGGSAEVSGAVDPEEAARLAEEAAERARMQVMEEIDQLAMQADMLYAEGKLDEATEKIKELLTGYLNKESDRVFYAIFNHYLSHGQLDAAKEFIFKINNNYPAINVQDACRQVFDALRANSQADALAWTQRLLGSKIPNDAMRANIHQWVLMLALEKKDAALMKQAVADLLKSTTPDAAIDALQQTGLPIYTQPESADLAAAFTDCVAQLTTGKKEFANLNMQLGIRLIVLKKQWADLPGAFQKAIATFPDKQLTQLFRTSVDGLRADKKLFAFNSICEELVFKVTDKPLTSRAAANCWMEIVQEQDLYASPSYIKRLIDADFNRDATASIYCSAFYKLIKSPKKLDDKELKAVNELSDYGMLIFKKLNKEDSYYDSVKLVLLDTSFLSERYDRATELLKSGMPGRDQVWVDSLLNKLNAHRCLKEGKYEEAIKHFRDFMKYIADNGEEETIDPSSGVIYTKGMIIARNEKRVASLYDLLGKKEDAQKCRAEATRLLKEAKAKTTSKETLAVIDEELATMNVALKPEDLK